MSDEDLDKLAKEMQAIKASDAARERGMDAAMAAFSAEFATENETASQGLEAGTRPTEQTTGKGPAASPWSDTMSKVKNFFTLKPPAMMMMGTCAAALFATSLYLPNTRFEEIASTPAPQVVTNDAKITEPLASTPESADVSSVTPKTETENALGVAIDAGPVTVEGPTVTTEVAPGATETPTTSVEIAAPSATPDLVEPRADIERTVSTEIKTAPSASEAETALPSDTVVIERRVLKSPARTMERVAPAIPKTVTRRVIKTPAHTVERSVPAMTKQETRQVPKEDGTFETVTETVVVTPQSVEYVTVPAEYETVTETVVVQEASTELVTIPPVYETVRETVRIGADGSTEVLSSETVPPLDRPAVGGITSISGLLDRVRTDSDASKSREAKFRTRAESESGFYASAPPAPAPEAMAMADDVIITGAKSKKSSSRRSRGDAAKIAAAPVMAPPPPPSIMSEPPAKPTIPPTSRLVERTIPESTKTISRRVIKTPASTVERVVPAITENVTVQVLAEDGTYKNVTKTFVIQPASVEYVNIPPSYETITETVPVEGGTEMVVIHADGTVEPWPPVVKKKPKPQPRPQSGLLTAGDYDDVLNPDLYKVYLDKMLQGPLKNKDLPYVDANNRINIRVVDSAGQPVPLADINMRTRNNNKMFPLRTGADGMAYIYPEFDGLERGTRLRISKYNGKTVRKTVSNKMIRNGGDIEIVLDTQFAPVKNLDLLLTIDATGSMGDEMRYLQTELKSIVGRVERTNPGTNIRTALVVYRDVGDDYIVREVPFTDNLDGFREALNAQNANGGGDRPEAMHTAMQTGLDMDWRQDAIKINLLVADAPPHDKHINKTWDAGLKSRTRGIHIVPLAASGVDKTAEFLMRSMAQITGGRYLFLTDDSGIGNPHAKPTVDCYIVTRLDGLVTRTISSLVKGERVEPQPGEVIRSVGNYRAGTCDINEQSQNPEPENAVFNPWKE